MPLHLHYIVVVWLLVCSVLIAKDQNDDTESCYDGDTIRLTAVQTNYTCGTVDGRVEVCEDDTWRNLCDGNWTVQDAVVTCRSLNYSSKGRL